MYARATAALRAGWAPDPSASRHAYAAERVLCRVFERERVREERMAYMCASASLGANRDIGYADASKALLERYRALMYLSPYRDERAAADGRTAEDLAADYKRRRQELVEVTKELAAEYGIDYEPEGADGRDKHTL